MASTPPADGTPALAPDGLPADAPIQGSPLASNVGPEVDRALAERPAAEEAPVEQALPEGYESWEQYGKDVASGKVKPATAEEAPADEAPAEGELPAEIQAEVDKLPESVREKAAPLFQEFATTGTLTPESKAAAAEAFGVTPEMVDLYMEGAAGRMAQNYEAAWTPVWEAAGGKETYVAFESWAIDGGLTPEEIGEFNEALNGTSEQRSTTVAKAIELWKAEGNGAPARDITRNQPGSDAGSGAADVYTSTTQMTKDMGSDLYKKDPAERARVDAKVMRSPI